MFDVWFDLNLDISRLDFSMVTLINKEVDARNMKKFRPISLHNCCIKIFTKVLTNRQAPIIRRLISEHQSTFVTGRFILESVVTAHEVAHSVHSSSQKGYYKKAYDRVSLDFLYEVLKLRGFGSKWIGLIRRLTHHDQWV